MPQVYIIAGILIAIILLACFVFIRQTITKRHKEKIRLQRALDKRAKDLVQMLNAFPPKFLPQDLLLFLYRCIVDTYEQLSKLSPDNPDYLEHFKAHTASMEAAMRTTKEEGEASLQSSAQINEIRHYLNHLGRFMQKWMQRGNLSTKQYANYKDLLKKLLTQLMVDNYVLSAKQAMQMEKTKLAMHYYTLAKNLAIQEGLLASKKNRLALINEELTTLERRLEKEEATLTSDVIAEEEESGDEKKQWQQYDDGADWKKKNVYD